MSIRLVTTDQQDRERREASEDHRELITQMLNERLDDYAPAPRALHTPPPEPDPTGDDFPQFLRWLHYEQAYEADMLIYVVEKPHKFASEYGMYLAADDRGSAA